jgi:site-specific DNA recombinase
VRTWGKQEKYEVLVDAEDVAAGYQTRMRWKDKADWIEASHQTHAQLVSDELIAAVRARSGAKSPGRTKARESAHPYSLRGILFCASCGNRMQGAFRKPSRVLYRCEFNRSRSIPPEMADHPRTSYVNETDITVQLDKWVESLADIGDLTAGQAIDPAVVARYSSMKAQLSEVDRKISILMTALESGVAADHIMEQLGRRSVERDDIAKRLERSEGPKNLSSKQVQALAAELGGIAAVLAEATAAERAEVYASLGIRLEYIHGGPGHRKVLATANLARVAGRVRGGT